MKKISRSNIRHKAVGNVLASLRIEKLQPSEDVVQCMQACMSGQETIANVRQQVLRRHVALRRG